jgi:hypothetical protein
MDLWIGGNSCLLSANLQVSLRELNMFDLDNVDSGVGYGLSGGRWLSSEDLGLENMEAI